MTEGHTEGWRGDRFITFFFFFSFPQSSVTSIFLSPERDTFNGFGYMLRAGDYSFFKFSL